MTLALTAVGGAAGAVAAATPAATTSLTDDTGVLTIDVPAVWTAVSTTPTTDDAGVSHAQIAAATDLDGLYKTYATPGVIYAEHDYVADTASAITTAYDFSAECTASAVTSYSDGYFTGSRLDWTGCSGTQSRVVTVLANPLDRSFSALVLVQLPTPADDAALDVVLGSFYVANPTSTALRDDTGTLAMSVPAVWTQAVTAPVTNAATGATTPSITASAPAAAGVPTPMASFTATPHTDDLDGALAALAATATGCTPGAPQDYADGYFTGRREDLTNCPGGLRTTVVAANAGDRADVTALMTVVTAPTDDVALNIVLDSFYFTTPDARDDHDHRPRGGEPPSPPRRRPSAPVTTTVAAAPTTTVAPPVPTTPTVTSLPTGWQQLTDGTDLLTVVVPVSWTNIDTSFWTYDSTPSVEQPAIVVGDGADTDTAGTDAFRVVAEPATDDLDALADANLPSCTAGLRVPFDNGHFVGLRQDFTGCDGTDHAVLIVADPPDHRFTLSAILYVRAGDEELIDPVLGGLGSTTATPYYWLTDASDLVTTKVPLWWSQWNGGPNTDSVTNEQRPGLSASQPTIGIETEDGLVLTAYHGQTPDALAAVNGHADRCTGDSAPVPYDDGVFTGLRRTWTDCDGVAGSQIVQVFASPADQSVTLALDVTLATPDEDVLDLVLNSFNVVVASVDTTTTTVAVVPTTVAPITAPTTAPVIAPTTTTTP